MDVALDKWYNRCKIWVGTPEPWRPYGYEIL
jgi:hypothetical protein